MQRLHPLDRAFIGAFTTNSCFGSLLSFQVDSRFALAVAAWKFFSDSMSIPAEHSRSRIMHLRPEDWLWYYKHRCQPARSRTYLLISVIRQRWTCCTTILWKSSRVPQRLQLRMSHRYYCILELQISRGTRSAAASPHARRHIC